METFDIVFSEGNGGNIDFSEGRGAIDKDDSLPKEVERINMETELFKRIADAVVKAMKANPRLKFADAFREVILSDSEVNKLFQEMKYQEITDKIMQMDISDLLRVLTDSTAEAKSIEFSEAFNVVKKDYPTIVMEFAANNVDEERLVLHQEATNLSKKKGISYRDAIYKIIEER